MAEPGKAQGTSQAQAFKDCYVDLVNPKLKSYNKPLFLATTIGFLTLVAGAVMLWMETDNNCTLQFTQPIIQSPYALKNIKESYEGFDCYVGLSISVPSPTGEHLVPCHRMDDGSDGLDQHFQADYCDKSVQDRWLPQAEISPHLPWDRTKEAGCKAEVTKYEGTWTNGDGVPDEGGGGGRWFEHCSEVLDKCMGTTGQVGLIWYQKCPDPFLVTGSVLGWVSWFEVLFTVAIIVPLYAIGYIKSGKHATHVKNLKGWLQELDLIGTTKEAIGGWVDPEMIGDA